MKLLDTIPAERLAQLANDPNYLKLGPLAEFECYIQLTTWASRVVSQMSPHHPIAYFCIEFDLHQSIKLYSVGLGVLAGDHLNSASDLGLSVVGVRLLYCQGYFQQHLNFQGWQEEGYVDQQFMQIPLELLRDSQEEPLTVKRDRLPREIFQL